MRRPTLSRAAAQAWARSGSFWLGRVGTAKSYGAPTP